MPTINCNARSRHASFSLQSFYYFFEDKWMDDYLQAIDSLNKRWNYAVKQTLSNDETPTSLYFQTNAQYLSSFFLYSMSMNGCV